MDSPQTYRRVDVVTIVAQTVGCTKVEAVGKLQNNSTWEVVFRDEYATNLFCTGHNVSSTVSCSCQQ